ncbi:hypothetical protein G4B88_018206 [Cannabis sativa]|uniref:Uncharacterized protein n=1 Tax=Cannabis sativa TaxID=3483 RepID=A0A7J6GBD7_CANSA|nr:hypothetical protein G4B88_018206 [Cannabis sativa]
MVRLIYFPFTIDFIRVDVYGCGSESSGNLRIQSDLMVDVCGKQTSVLDVFSCARTVVHRSDSSGLMASTYSLPHSLPVVSVANGGGSNLPLPSLVRGPRRVMMVTSQRPVLTPRTRHVSRELAFTSLRITVVFVVFEAFF